MAEDNSLESIDPRVLKALRKAWNEYPEERVKIQQAMKKADPTLDIPGLEIAETKAALKAEFDKKADELQGEVRKLRVETANKEAIAELRQQGFTDEDLQSVEKLITEKGFPDYKLAARHFRLEQQAAMPTPSRRPPAKADTVPDEVVKGGDSAVSSWARTEFEKGLNDMQRAGLV
jgi:hypothetical protein